jgi:hypothetical protein
MSTTLFDAKPFDESRARRKAIVIWTTIAAVIIIAALAWWFRYWPEEHKVDQFFTALENKNYEQAYTIWTNDPQWKQHQEKHARYPFGEFYIDWGPGGEWGLVKSHKVDGSAAPKGAATGVVVVVTVNDRAEKARVWVEKADKTLAFSPY